MTAVQHRSPLEGGRAGLRRSRGTSGSEQVKQAAARSQAHATAADDARTATQDVAVAHHSVRAADRSGARRGVRSPAPPAQPHRQPARHPQRYTEFRLPAAAAVTRHPMPPSPWRAIAPACCTCWRQPPGHRRSMPAGETVTTSGTARSPRRTTTFAAAAPPLVVMPFVVTPLVMALLAAPVLAIASGTAPQPAPASVPAVVEPGLLARGPRAQLLLLAIGAVLHRLPAVALTLPDPAGIQDMAPADTTHAVR